MNDRDICRCHHQRGDHHPLLGLCAHATGTREACVCTAFVLVAGSTTASERTVNRMEDLGLIRSREAERLRVTAARTGARGMDHVADLTTGRGTRLARLAAERRAAVLHPIAQASAAERCQIDANDGTDGINVIGVDAIEVENIEWAPHPPCYGCGHPWDMHEEGTMGRGLACRDTIESFIAERDTQSVKQCPCPVYVESPPPDACGRCGHAKSLHQAGSAPYARCFGTGVDTDGNERARACPCGRQGGYVPELPAEPGPLDEMTRDPNCMCGHPESLHGPMERADQLLSELPRLHTCLARAVEGGYADGCIEFRPATITHTLANGQVVSHTAKDPR